MRQALAHGARDRRWLGSLGANADPHKTVPIPRCFWAGSNPLCKCDRAGRLAADDVGQGHFRGKFQMAPSGSGTPSATDATNAGELAAAGWRTENWAGLRKSRPKSAHPLDQRGLGAERNPERS